MFRFKNTKIALLIIFGVFIFTIACTHVAAEEDLEQLCDLDNIDNQCQGISDQQCQALLEKCKEYYENKANKLEGDINDAAAKEKSYTNQVYILNSKINKLKNQIYQSNLIVKDLGYQISDTEHSIDETTVNIEQAKKKLIAILRTIYEEDQKSILEIFLGEDTLSDFFGNLVSLELLDSKNKELLIEVKNLNSYLQEQKNSLNQEKDDLEKQVLIQRLQQQDSEKAKEQEEYLLNKVKGEKALYEEYLKEVKTNAQEIRKRIFQLAQIPEAEAPSLEQAYQLAKYVEGVTGIRPAFLLGLLQTESRIGQNVGQCNCSYCRYPDIDWKTVMSKNQWDAFLLVTQQLGLDSDNVPVSCWVGGGSIQMGGAMGPAQFMPNTWLNPSNPDKGYKTRIEALSGTTPANPWRIADAFLAAGLYLSDWGANSQQLYDEIGAATAYLCGTSRMTSRCIAAGGKAYIYGWTDKSGVYHSGVMDYAAEFQDYIDSGVFENGT